jgi:ribosomal protein L12E/L44/L45/RPP1/RPP2
MLMKTNTPITQLQQIHALADRIGIDHRDAEIAIVLARTGRQDLLNAVASGRMTICAALAQAKTSHASSQRAAALQHGSE